MPERLAGLVPEMPNPHLVLSAEITSTIGYRVLAVNPLRIRSVTSIPNNTSTVGAQWRALQDQEWILQKLGNPEDDLSEVGAWLDERKSTCCTSTVSYTQLVGGLVGNGPLPETSAGLQRRYFFRPSSTGRQRVALVSRSSNSKCTSQCHDVAFAGCAKT